MIFLPLYFVVIFFLVGSVQSARTRSVNPDFPRPSFDEKNVSHWRLRAQWTLRSKINAPLNKKVAKNVILFLGDGMSITTLAAARVYLGQKYGHSGEDLKLSFESFPFTGLAKWGRVNVTFMNMIIASMTTQAAVSHGCVHAMTKITYLQTYCVDQNVADSACSGTAYLTGVKANSGTVGVSAAVKRGDCARQLEGNHSVTGLIDWAQKAGKATGVVTTTRVTHATPAASYAHSAERRWESDTDIPKGGPKCEDIASQLVRGQVGSRINVVLGGGRKNFFPKNYTDPENVTGYRSDGTNLVNEWLARKSKYTSSAKYIYNRTDLLKLDLDVVDNLLGLFSPDHMPYHLEAKEDDPSLTEMTQKAIQILSKNKKGYFLFVEGGRIDTAHHETKARKALDETAEFAKAVEAAMRMVDPENTLVVVTSDHSHTMTYSGYSKRGTDILGFTNKSNATDHLPYTTLSYANGPGFKMMDNNTHFRHDLQLDNLDDMNYLYPALVPLARETHGGEDVAVFAKGPWAHLFTGSYEQNFLPHAIAYASCMGPGLTSCSN